MCFDLICGIKKLLAKELWTARVEKDPIVGKRQFGRIVTNGNTLAGPPNGLNTGRLIHSQTNRSLSSSERSLGKTRQVKNLRNLDLHKEVLVIDQMY